MRTHETDHAPATSKQLAILTGEIAVALAEANPAFARVQKLLMSKLATRRKISAAVLKALEIECAPVPRLLAEQQFWAKLGIALTVDELNMPEIPSGWSEVAIKPAGVTNEQLFALIQQERKKRGEDAWKYYGNLDDVKEEQARPKGTYVFAYCGDSEPDALYRGKMSYDLAIAAKLTFLTLSERLIAELRAIVIGKYFDAEGWTITSSLASGGCAFGVCWRSGDRVLGVGGCRRSSVDPRFGPRQAVFSA